MDNVVALQPIAETLEFEGAAIDKTATLLQRMIDAAKRLAAARDHPEHDRLHQEFVQLQREHARAVERVQFLSEMFASANQHRLLLWDELPNEKDSALVASNDAKTTVVIMRARRSCARINCSDFHYLERHAGRIEQAI